MRATWLAIFRSHSMVCTLASGVHRMGVPADVRDGVVYLRVLRDGFGVVASYYVLPSIDRRIYLQLSRTRSELAAQENRGRRGFYSDPAPHSRVDRSKKHSAGEKFRANSQKI